jgi:hypothetical protein
MVRLGKASTFKKNGPKPALDDPPEYLIQHPVVVDWYPKLQATASGAGFRRTPGWERHSCYFEESHLAFLDLMPSTLSFSGSKTSAAGTTSTCPAKTWPLS